MKAFHGKEAVKKKYVLRVQKHRKADELIQKVTWNVDTNKGCAVGCTLHQYSHAAYETELGIPSWLARVEDQLFEGVSVKYSKTWPERFLKAIKPGADLEKAKAPFLIFVLESALQHFDHKKSPKCKAAIDGVIRLYKTGETDIEKFRDARLAAYAADGAAYAADGAAYAADGAAYAADAAADAAAYAAYAADAADAAYAAAYAASARSKEFEKFADKLLEILKDIK